MKVLENILVSIKIGSNNISFFIAGKSYTYTQLKERVIIIQGTLPANDITIGISMDDDLDTYAGILAILFSGKAYVPLNPLNPLERNQSVIEQANIGFVLCAEKENANTHNGLKNCKIVCTKELEARAGEIVFKKETNGNCNAYILFTSGSTGLPKGVPISRNNLDAFVDSFFKMGYNLSSNDKFLQMFDLTFDLSIMSYIVPLSIGASVYTVPFSGIKYTNIYLLLEDHQLTFALMVPSIIGQLKPYFDEIKLEHMRYSLFCGEALHEEITRLWSDCVPNAQIDNVYGPTEATIFCTQYTYKKSGSNKSANGILSIGKAMHSSTCVIVDENNNILPAGEKGELCLAGPQLTTGYINNESKNKESFFLLNYRSQPTTFYRTGDVCMSDADGDIYYYGRKDNQVKIQGFRVELSEIEHHARTFLEQKNAVAAVAKNKTGNDVIILFTENSSAINRVAMLDFMKTKMPSYMIPAEIIDVEKFPLNANGKTDRKQLQAMHLPK